MQDVTDQPLNGDGAELAVRPADRLAHAAFQISMLKKSVVDLALSRTMARRKYRNERKTHADTTAALFRWRDRCHVAQGHLLDHGQVLEEVEGHLEQTATALVGAVARRVAENQRWPRWDGAPQAESCRECLEMALLDIDAGEVETAATLLQGLLFFKVEPSAVPEAKQFAEAQADWERFQDVLHARQDAIARAGQEGCA
jgi:hypothetical protein